MCIIKEFIRDEIGKPYGCMVANVINYNGVELVSIGVSMCHKQDKNKWDKKLATEIAEGRANTVGCEMRLPKYVKLYDDECWVFSAEDDVEKFVKRCCTYFQDKPVVFPRIKWF